MTIALMLCERAPRTRKQGCNLVVCPKSMLPQWIKEIIEKVNKSACLKVLKYYGGKRDIALSTLYEYDVVITTYGTLASDFAHETSPPLALESSVARKRKRKSASTLFEAKWFRIILDEAQNVKNSKTKTFQAANSLKVERRWCVSGTPL